MIRAPSLQPDWLQYEDANRVLAQRANLFADVSRCLPRHQARFAAAARGTLHGSDGRAYPSEHGLGLWVAPEHAITEAQDGFLFGTYRSDGWGSEPVPRALQIVRIGAPQPGRSLVVANVHGIRQPGGKGDTPERKIQCDTLVTALKAFARPDEPMVVLGDFNLLPGSRTFAALGELGLTDLVTSRGFNDTRTSLYPKPERHADYALVSSGVDVRLFDVPAQPEVSDHRPLIIELAL